MHWPYVVRWLSVASICIVLLYKHELSVWLLSGGVHYRDKETVSWRLSLSGLAVAYNQTVSRYQGPYPTMLTLDLMSRTLTLLYDDGSTAITVRTTDGFEVVDKLTTVFILSLISM